YIRQELCARRAREAGAALAFVNMLGGQDELVFDGGSMVVDATGRTVAHAPQFCDALLVADLDLPAAGPGRPPGETPADAGDGTVITIRRLELKDPDHAERSQAGPVTQQPGTWAAKCLDGPAGGLAEVYAA